MKQKKLLNLSPGNKDRPKGVRVSTAPSRAQPCDLTPSHNPYLPAMVSALPPTLPQTRDQVFNTWDLKRFLSNQSRNSDQRQRLTHLARDDFPRGRSQGSVPVGAKGLLEAPPPVT